MRNEHKKINITRIDEKNGTIFTFSSKNHILFTVLILTLISGCTAPFISNKPLTPVHPSLLVHDVENHAAKLQTFQGRTMMTIESAEGAFRGSMRFSVKLPDSLWLKMEGPLGIDMAVGRFGGDNALFFIPAENLVYKGTIQSMQENGILPFDFASSDMLQGIFGLPIPYTPGNDSLLSVTIESRKYILNLGYGEKIWIEPRGPMVTRWEKRDTNGELQWTWEGREFRKRKGIFFPQVIRMTNSQPRQRLTLVYETVKPNRSMKNGWFDIRLPEGVETIEL